jgi:hypothetical protein
MPDWCLTLRGERLPRRAGRRMFPQESRAAGVSAKPVNLFNGRMEGTAISGSAAMGIGMRVPVTRRLLLKPPTGLTG